MHRVWNYMILVFFVFPLGTIAQDFEEKSVDILSTTRLSIDGEANVKNFTCIFNSGYLERKKKISYSTDGKKIYFKNAVLNLRNEGFNCGHKAIDKDFHLLLKTKEYPKVIFEMMSFTLKEDQKGEAEVMIEIAGIRKKYVFPVSLRPSPINRFVGKLKLNIRDFDLEPPKKLMGLIVIKEEIEISFDLLAKY